MYLRALSVLVVLSLSFAACAVDPSPGPAESTATAAVSWDCASVCFQGVPCHNLCKLTLDEPGFAVVTGPMKCDAPRRQINKCGDGCCDDAEAHFADPSLYCRADCTLARLDIIKLDGPIQLIENDALLGTVEPSHVSVARPVCR